MLYILRYEKPGSQNLCRCSFSNSREPTLWQSNPNGLICDHAKTFYAQTVQHFLTSREYSWVCLSLRAIVLMMRYLRGQSLPSAHTSSRPTTAWCGKSCSAGTVGQSASCSSAPFATCSPYLMHVRTAPRHATELFGKGLKQWRNVEACQGASHSEKLPGGLDGSAAPRARPTPAVPRPP